MPDCVLRSGCAGLLRSAAANLSQAAGEAPCVTLRPCVDDIGDPMLKRLHRYWLALCGEGGAVPPQEKIDPFALRFALGRINIVAPADAQSDDFYFRLGGTDVARHYGFELTGKTVTSAFVPASADFYLAAFRLCHRSAAPLHIVETPPPSVPVTSWEHLLLPFADTSAQVSRLLCGMVPGKRRKTDGSPPPPAWRRR